MLENSNDENFEQKIITLSQIPHKSCFLVPSRRPPPDKTHCTVIVMVGLPGAGKTTWVKQYLREHPDEHWILFNTDSIINAMTVCFIFKFKKKMIAI